MNTVQEKSEQGSRKSSTQARHQALHDRLVLAAEQAVAEQGGGALRARSLAEAAGCSVGAIYGVFPDLDALMLVVNGRTLAAIDGAMRAASGAGGPAEHLVQLAEAYLAYASANRRRWDALFQHRLPEGAGLPAWYVAGQVAAFSHIEGPLGVLLPGMGEAERALLARSLFSAVHGMVALGLDEKVAAMTLPVLRGQLRMVVSAVGAGLAG